MRRLRVPSRDMNFFPVLRLNKIDTTVAAFMLTRESERYDT